MKNLPENIRSIGKQEKFIFSCHPGVSCFTECCRLLELSLSPYDVIRLKKSLNISSSQFLDQYAVIEFTDEDLFPRVFLGMVDDGRASCPFVNQSGCSVYSDRPGACRTYPVGRGAQRSNNESKELFVLVQEPHCMGFKETAQNTVESWEQSQGVDEYNINNDMILSVYNSNRFIQGKPLTTEEARLFILALFNIDEFKRRYSDIFNHSHYDDTQVLEKSIEWLKQNILL